MRFKNEELLTMFKSLNTEFNQGNFGNQNSLGQFTVELDGERYFISPTIEEVSFANGASCLVIFEATKEEYVDSLKPRKEIGIIRLNL